jgi:hypothetical protein
MVGFAPRPPAVCDLISWHEIKSHTEREKVVSRTENNGLARFKRTCVPLRHRRLPRSTIYFLLSYRRTYLT